ncbi:glycosyltransferase family 39 protein [Bartonella sp. HY329]|uniref:ArnT family glycosyltransferase n=1 Tax=unclassified Bartonella TaxID=2645622 RepID=UPI0021C6A0F2|nr:MULTISPECIES: glycosyltransferase family 39 protein [unclassified Bartonella]UXM94594.1 glycosyltransferase family 39 protein [Bartonella sp. HY329]UXN08917.1 glycosyltransferase family 39 protein [Bartonella sp. HY328]
MSKNSIIVDNNQRPQEAEYCGSKFAFWALIFIVGYFLCEALFVSFISNGAGLDDAEQLANISFFDWGYGGSQPPLYTWILIAATSVFGTHFFVLQLVKFSILGSLFLSVYFGLRNLKVRLLVAASAMLGIFLLPQIAWESQRALSHSVLGTASCGWFFWAMTRYMHRQSVVNAILVGFCIAVSVLGKFNDIIFIVAILMASLSFKQGRKCLFQLKTLLILTTAAILLYKPLCWIIAHLHATLERSNKFGVASQHSFIIKRLLGAEELVHAVFAFGGLAFIVALVVYLFNRPIQNGLDYTETEEFAAKFIGRVLGFGLLIVFISIILSGSTQVKDRWMQPVLILCPAYFSIMLFYYTRKIRALISYGVCGIIVALMVPIVLFFSLHQGSGRHLPLGLLDYNLLYSTIEKEGPIATIVSPNTKYAGNLRLYNPDIKVVHNETVNAEQRLQFPLLILDDIDADKLKDPEAYGQAFKGSLGEYIYRLTYKAGPKAKTIKIAYKGHPDQFKIFRYFYIP